MDNVSQIDWARLAAYIDGEGSIDIHEGRHATNGGPNLYVRIHVTNTDPRLSEWLKKNFGGSVYLGNRKNGKWKSCYWWMCVSKTAVEILKGCMPYFLLKREQAEIALAFQRTVWKCGVKGHGPEVLEYRRQLKRQMSVVKNRGNKYTNEETPATLVN